MRLPQSLLLLILSATLCPAQLTMDQKISDFQYMAGVYAKRYGPYEWKRDTIGFDLFNVTPWLDKVRATKTDLEFYDLASQYVASLNDAHDTFILPSSFSANLNFSVDVYDGKLLVDSHAGLALFQYPISNGYELVSIDGVDAQKLVDGLLVYATAANPRSTRRFAAQYLTSRFQQLIPSAPNVPDVSTVVFRRPDGKLETYNIPWTKSGLALTSIGKFTTPQAVPSRKFDRLLKNSRITDSLCTARSAEFLFSLAPCSAADALVGKRPADDPQTDGTSNEMPPDPMPAFARLRNWQIPQQRLVRGFGSVAPIFVSSLPASFVRRLGGLSTDFFYSGTFSAGGLTVGYIRIPSFSPINQSAAFSAFTKEIAYFQTNTDGLVVDVMRNPGGDGAYTNALLSYLIPFQWRAIGFELRATSEWVAAVSSALESAKAQGAPQDYIDKLQAIKDAIVEANQQMRGRTTPIPLDDVTLIRDPLTDSKGNPLAYTKPLMLLTDEMSASAAEVFAATIQDNARGTLFGWRTMGAGGNVEDWYGGSYSEGLDGFMSVTESLMNRKSLIVTSDYPAASYVENIGVRPDIQADYMTADNLAKNGKPFVDAFVAAAADYIQKNK